MGIAKVIETFISMLYPDVCTICGSKENFDLVFKQVCKKCIAKIPIRQKNNRIVSCIEKTSPIYDKRSLHANTNILVACEYEGQIKKSLLNLKFYEAEYFGCLMAEILVYLFNNQIKDIDYIVPIPLHNERLQQRGYNQAMLIAKEVSRLCNVEILDNLLIRTSNTKRQSELKNKEIRMLNLNEAFEITDNSLLKGKSVIIIDDVLTSGATMYHAIKKMNETYKGDINILGMVVASNRN